MQFDTRTRIDKGYKSFESQFRNKVIEHHCPQADPLPLYKRTGHGNYEIHRPSNYREPPLPRKVKFDTPSIISTETGNKLSKEIYVRVPDVLDEEWVLEHQRLSGILRIQFTVAGRSEEIILALIDRELNANLPLGRPQRTIEKKSSDIANLPIDLNTKLLDIINEVKEGRVENLDTKKEMLVQLVSIFNKKDTLSELMDFKQQELNDLGVTIQNLGISRNNSQMGLPDIVDNEFFKRNRGVICVYLLGGAIMNLSGLDPNKPIFGINGRPIGLFSMNSTLIAMANGYPNTILDLRNRAMIIMKNIIPELIRIVTTGDGSYNINLALNFNATQLKELKDAGVTQDVYDSNNLPAVSIVIP